MLGINCFNYSFNFPMDYNNISGGVQYSARKKYKMTACEFTEVEVTDSKAVPVGVLEGKEPVKTLEDNVPRVLSRLWKSFLCIDPQELDGALAQGVLFPEAYREDLSQEKHHYRAKLKQYKMDVHKFYLNLDKQNQERFIEWSMVRAVFQK